LKVLPSNTIPFKEDTKVNKNAVLQDQSDEPMSPMEYGSQISQLPVSSAGVKAQDDPENPDTDWALNTTFLGTVTAYCFGVCLAMACFIFTKSRYSYGVSPLEGVSVVGGGIPLAFWEMYCLVLCSIIIELAVPQDMPWLRRSLLSLNIGLLLTVWALFTTNLSLAPRPYQSMAIVGIYIVSALIHRIVGRTKTPVKG
jgi:hypothetical protein